MKKNRSIQFKAAFLLFIFSLNMVVGFACAIGVDMEFNTTHHHDTDAVKIHTHADGKKHEHHNKVNEHHEKKNNTKNEEKEGCCNDAVVKISQTDKAFPQSNTVVQAIFFSTFIASFYNIDIFSFSQIAGNSKYFLQNYHPPIADIRIAIQSFQI